MTIFKMSSDPGGISTLDLLSPKLGFTYAWLIYKFGYRTALDLQRLTDRDIRAIPGIGCARAETIRYEIDLLVRTRQENTAMGNVVYLRSGQADLFESFSSQQG